VGVRVPPSAPPQQNSSEIIYLFDLRSSHGKKFIGTVFAYRSR
jgi:hypothetical protein